MKFSHMFMGFVLGAGISLVMVVVGLIPSNQVETILLQGAVAAIAAAVVHDAEKED